MHMDRDIVTGDILYIEATEVKSGELIPGWCTRWLHEAPSPPFSENTPARLSVFDGRTGGLLSVFDELLHLEWLAVSRVYSPDLESSQSHGGRIRFG
jgi:hypothetical protein